MKLWLHFQVYAKPQSTHTRSTIFQIETQELLVLSYVSNIGNCLAFCIKFGSHLQTGCKAHNELAILHTWPQD